MWICIRAIPIAMHHRHMEKVAESVAECSLTTTAAPTPAQTNDLWVKRSPVRERERRANAYTTLAPWRRRYWSSQDLHHGCSYVLPLDVTEKIDQLVSMTIALHADVTIMPESISTMQVTIGVPTTATKRGTLP